MQCQHEGRGRRADELTVPDTTPITCPDTMTAMDLLKRAVEIDLGPPLFGELTEPWIHNGRQITNQEKAYVSYRGDGKWAVTIEHSSCLGKDGELHYEPLPSSRTDEFRENTRFDSVQEAIQAFVERNQKLLTAYRAEKQA